MSEPSAPAKKTRRDSLQDLLGTALLGLTLAPGMAKAEEEITEKVGGGDGLPDQCVVVLWSLPVDSCTPFAKALDSRLSTVIAAPMHVVTGLPGPGDRLEARGPCGAGAVRQGGAGDDR